MSYLAAVLHWLAVVAVVAVEASAAGRIPNNSWSQSPHKYSAPSCSVVMCSSQRAACHQLLRLQVIVRKETPINTPHQTNAVLHDLAVSRGT